MKNESVGADHFHGVTALTDAVPIVELNGAEISQLKAENEALRGELVAQKAAHASELDGLNQRVAAIEARAEGQTPATMVLFGGWAGGALALAGVAGLGLTVGRHLR